jgi:hypothetical protein
MNITSPILATAAHLAALLSYSVNASFKTSEGAGLFDGPDGGLGMVMSGLSGIAAALAVAIVLTVYFRSGYRRLHDVGKHSLATLAAFALVAFVAYDMRQATFTYLGINPSKPAVEFEIRLPTAVLSAGSETQVELHTDRNQTLAQMSPALDSSDGHSVLRGAVTLDYRTTERVVVLNLAGQAQCEFKLRLSADPSRSDQFGPWHLVDRIASPTTGEVVGGPSHDAFAIRYRVL